MAPIRFALIEYIRRLEEQHHVFATDPARVNALLKQEEGVFEQKLWLRAERIDSDKRLQTLLQNVFSRFALLRQGLCLLWLVLGIFSAMGLMQTAALNFFYVLVSVLGINALMFGLWLIYLFKPQATVPTWVISAITLKASNKAEVITLMAMVREWLSRPQMKWFWGKLSHQMWLASLTGLLLGVITMLLVRQYTFNWQSTLLDEGGLSAIVSVLAFVPNLLGLNVPDAQTVAASQSIGDVAFSRLWANLLWSSLLVYGIVPRLIAWCFCRRKAQSLPLELPLDKPYYQRLKRMWQTQVVDSAADYRPDAKRTNTRTIQVAAQCIVAAWETLPPQSIWQHQRPENSVDLGLIDGRTEQEMLLQRLKQTPSQLQLWVRLHSLPDRGSMRRFNAYADHAQGGLVVCLWAEELDAERLQMWQQALDEQAIAWQWKEVTHE